MKSEMTEDNEDYSDYSEEEKFDYYNSDLKQLILHILLEGYFRGQALFTLDQFLKGNYWKMEEISEAIRDTNDYGSVEDMVLNQVIEILGVLKIGKIKKISLKGLLSLPELFIAKIIKEPIDEDKDFMIGYYTAILDEIYELKKKSDMVIEERMKNGEKWTENIRDIDFKDTYEALRSLGYTCVIAPSHIAIEIDFNEDSARNIDKEINDYLCSFSQDDFVENKPDYKEKRYYFSKQLENFYNYIKELPVINDSINIPFTVLSEQGFEVIKILAYLEREKKIKVRNWNDVDMWSVKFFSQPITLQGLAKIDKKPEDKTHSEKIAEPKINYKEGILYFQDKEIDFNNKPNQKELLDIIFEDRNKDWFYDEMLEKWDDLKRLNLIKLPEKYWKKFDTAGNSINEAIAVETTIKDFIKKNSKKIRINPKYI